MKLKVHGYHIFLFPYFSFSQYAAALDPDYASRQGVKGTALTWGSDFHFFMNLFKGAVSPGVANKEAHGVPENRSSGTYPLIRIKKALYQRF